MRSVLAACRRILLAVLIALVLLGGWAYWKAPSLDELRPQLESLLARQLGLKELHLGRLSWRWAGHVWLNAANITFVGSEKRIMVDDAQLEVRLSSLDLIRGDIRPTSISLRHGRIALHIPKAASGESFPLPSGLLHIEDSTVTLNYGAFTNRFEHLDLLIDADHRTLGMQLPGFTLDVAWNSRLQPEHVDARFDNLQWLPEEWRAFVHGPFSARLQLDKLAGSQAWDLLADVNSDDGMEILGSSGRARVPVNEAHARARILAGANPLDITEVDWREFVWRAGDNRIQAQGKWADGSLQLELRAPMLQLPVLATWGMPLADEAWQTWLAGLAGTAKDVKADVHLVQASPWSPPQFSAMRQGDVRIDAALSDASIPLLAPGEVLQELSGTLSLGSKGLDMQVSSLRLPFQAGVVHGQARIADLARPVFDIDGRGVVDIGLCEAWLHADALPQVVWKKAPADARFTFSWPMLASLPDKGDAQFVPQPAWQADVLGYPLSLSGGSLRWQADGGLSFKDMDVAFEGLGGNFDMSIRLGSAGEWKLLGLRLDSSGAFPDLASRLRMPIDGAAGRYGMALSFDPKRQKSPWDFRFELKDAGWRSLLGSQKKPGEPYVLEATGSQAAKGVSISRIQSKGTAPFISGSGDVSPQLALLHIAALQSSAFSGSLSIRLPLGQAANLPLEIDVNSDFLDQSALPTQIPDMAKQVSIMPDVAEAKRKWVLRGSFTRVHWDAVSIRGVRVYFASSTQGVGRLEAGAMDAAQFSLRNVRAYFKLVSGGRVDIRHLGAEVLGQQMNLSGTLQPEPGGGLRWTGFTDINGDFSQVIHRLDAARLFKGGIVHALWSGSGVIREDKPWWNGMQGRLRLRSDDGRILEGGTMTKLLAALSLADLPGFLTGARKDITGPGMLYKRLQLEASVQGETADITKLAMRASALDMAGKGKLNLADGMVDLYVVARPLQNIDALLNMIPLLRDVILGPAKSVFRKVYHVHGPLHDATVEAVSAEQAGLPGSGLLEQLITLPGRWFDAGRKAAGEDSTAVP